MFFITSLTSLSLLPELADVAVEALVVKDDEDAVVPVKAIIKLNNVSLKPICELTFKQRLNRGECCLDSCYGRL